MVCKSLLDISINNGGFFKVDTPFSFDGLTFSSVLLMGTYVDPFLLFM